MRKIAMIMVIVLTITFTFNASNVEVEADGGIVATATARALIGWVLSIALHTIADVLIDAGMEVTADEAEMIDFIQQNYDLIMGVGLFTLVHKISGETLIEVDTTNNGATPVEDTDLARAYLYDEPATTPLRQQFIDWYKANVTWSSSWNKWKVVNERWNTVDMRFYTYIEYFDTLYDTFDAWPLEYRQFYNEFVGQWDTLYNDSLTDVINANASDYVFGDAYYTNGSYVGKNTDITIDQVPAGWLEVNAYPYKLLSYSFSYNNWVVYAMKDSLTMEVDDDSNGGWETELIGNPVSMEVYRWNGSEWYKIQTVNNYYGKLFEVANQIAAYGFDAYFASTWLIISYYGGYIFEDETSVGDPPQVEYKKPLPYVDEGGDLVIPESQTLDVEKDENDQLIIVPPSPLTHDDALQDPVSTEADLLKEQITEQKKTNSLVETLIDILTIDPAEDPNNRITGGMQIPSLPNLFGLLVIILIQILLLFIKGFILVGLIFKIQPSTALFHPDTIAAITKTKALTLGGFDMPLYDLLQWIVAFVFTFILLKTLKRHLDTFRVT